MQQGQPVTQVKQTKEKLMVQGESKKIERKRICPTHSQVNSVQTHPLTIPTGIWKVNRSYNQEYYTKHS